MMRLARATLESLLRERKLDRTLTAFPPDLPSSEGTPDEYATASSGVTTLDARLGGGFPRGELSEIVGVRSSGRTSLVLHLLAAATGRHELVALIDVLDMLDVASAEAAGIDLSRLLWIRGGVMPNLGANHEMNGRALDRAIKAITLVLQAGNFGVVVFDAADAPPQALQRLPFTTWPRLHRIIEKSQTVCVLVGGSQVARSAGGVTVKLRRAGEAGGVAVRGHLLTGLEIEIDVIRARARYQDDVRVPLSTACC